MRIQVIFYFSLFLIFSFLLYIFFFRKFQTSEKPSVKAYVKVNNKMKGPFSLCNKNTKNCKSPACSNPCCNTILLEMLEKVSKVFQDKNKDLFLSGKTLLGLTRNKGFIPTEDEIEVGTTISKQEFLDLKKDLKDFIVKDNVIFYSKHNRNKLRINFTDKNVYPLKEDSFYHLQVKVPSFVNKVNINSPFYSGPVLKRESETKIPNEKYNIKNCFIINLPWRHDRLHDCIDECDKYNLPCERFPAVIGKDLDLSKIPLDLKRNMKNNEIGCYLSHFNVLKKIASLSDGNYIVFEDDIRFRNNFDSVLRKIQENPIPYDIIFLGAAMYNPKEVELVTPYLVKTGLTTGTWAYMINPQGAKKIVEKMLPISYPIDLTITVPDKKFSKQKVAYDNRFQNLEKYCVFTGEFYPPDNERIGIVDETSTFTKDSMSSV